MSGAQVDNIIKDSNKVSGNHRAVSLYGVGITSPGAANLREFMSLIQEGKPALSPIGELQGAFLVGNPKFDFNSYSNWI